MGIATTRVVGVIALFAVADVIIRLMVSRTKPVTAHRFLPWMNKVAWLLWFSFLVLWVLGQNEKRTFLIPTGMLIYSTAMLVLGRVKSQAEFETPRLRRTSIHIPSRTLIRVTDLDAASAWYTQKLGLRKLLDQTGYGSLTFKFGSDDEELCLVTDGTVTPFYMPRPAVWFSRNLEKARKELMQGGIEPGPIEVDATGAEHFEFRDPEGNVIEVCNRD